MDRVLQNAAATIYARFYLDGTGTDPTPDSATVTITRANGTVLVASTAATNAGTGGLFSYQLTTSHTALLDRLTASWTSNLGTITTTVEVAGGFLFSIPQARQIAPLDDTVTYTTDALKEKRVLVEQALEDACSVAFVPRYERERLTGLSWNTTQLGTKWAKVRTVRESTVGGTAVDAAGIASMVPVGRFVYYPAGWGLPTYPYDVTVGYEHGYDTPPARVSEAALLLLKNWMVKGPVDDRTTSFSTEDGTFSLSTPGLRGVTFGIPEVDAVVEKYGLSLTV
jgi:hypothetical protein